MDTESLTRFSFVQDSTSVYTYCHIFSHIKVKQKTPFSFSQFFRSGVIAQQLCAALLFHSLFRNGEMDVWKSLIPSPSQHRICRLLHVFARLQNMHASVLVAAIALCGVRTND